MLLLNTISSSSFRPQSCPNIQLPTKHPLADRSTITRIITSHGTHQIPGKQNGTQTCYSTCTPYRNKWCADNIHPVIQDRILGVIQDTSSSNTSYTCILVTLYCISKITCKFIPYLSGLQSNKFTLLSFVSFQNFQSKCSIPNFNSHQMPTHTHVQC